MNADLGKHILRYALIIILFKSILFVVGSFIENQTMPMAIITLAYLIAFCSISMLMIRNVNRSTNLRFSEKAIVIIGLFIIHGIWGILLHTVYFLGILGQQPTTEEFLSRIIEILKFDSHILIITLLVSIFIKSKATVTDKTAEQAK